MTMSSAVVARIALFVYVLSVGVRLAAARPEFTNLVPNGDNVPTCSHIGHNDCKSGAPRNQFGKDFAAAGMKWTKALCEKDSDGDGVTNGEELGDPCCTWTKANGGAKGFRSSGLSHPGDAGDKAAKSQPKCADANKSDSPTTTTPSGASSGSSSSTAAPTTTTSSSSNNVCFPSSALVELSSGAMVPISTLSIGDLVRVGPGKDNYSPVFMFTHKDPDATNHFVVIETASGASITLTPSHFIYSDGNLVPASAVTLGASLTLASGSRSTVTAVSATTAQGLFNPQTAHGDIVVDGIVASTYTTAIKPTLAHALLAPLRSLLAPIRHSLLVYESGVDNSVVGRAFLRFLDASQPAAVEEL